MNASVISTARPDRQTRWLGSAYYLLFFAALGACWPYFNLFFQSVGMSNQQIAALATLSTLTTLVASPSWSLVADQLHLRRRLLPLLMAGSIPPLLLIRGAGTFEVLALLLILWTLMNAPVSPLADSAILDMLGEAREHYGTLRLWGAVGFGLSAWAAGIAAERFGLPVVFLLFGSLMAVAALIAARLPIPTIVPVEPFFVSIQRLSRDRLWMGFLGAVILVGIGYAMVDNFLLIHLKALGAGESLFGLMVAAAGVGEIPVFFFSGSMIRRLMPRGVLLIAFLVFALRALLYSVLPDPTWAVGVHLLHGLSFSAMLAAGVIYVSRIAPPGLSASAQAAFGVAFMAVGRALGALLGAALYDSIGAVLMFRTAAGVALLGAILFGLVAWRFRPQAEPSMIGGVGPVG